MLAIAAVAASQTFSTPTAEAQAPACDPEANRATIQALYEETGGPEWTTQPPMAVKDSWLTEGATLQRWFITRFNIPLEVDGDGCVTRIGLFTNNLVGQPPSLEALTRLTHLNLSGNQLEGTVKSLGIADLVLSSLNLSNNKFSGQVLGSAGTVAERDIHPQAFAGGGSFWLFGNDFTGPIPDLSANVGITDFYIDNNRFNELIPDRLPQLTDIQIRYNLRAHNNEFSGEFPDLSGEYLSSLNLSHNNFSGELNPEHLRIWRLMGAPNNNISRITDLNLSHNNFSGELPDLSDRIGSSLAKIFLSDNNFSGELDLSRINSRVDTLDVSNNMLTGNIPNFKADKPNMTKILISGNKFSDTTLPVARFNEATLVSLHAANLGFTGPVPDFTGFSKLSTIDLSGNSFTGTFADLNLPAGRTSTIDLSGNMLTGDLQILSTFTNMTNLHLADNKFTGPVVVPGSLFGLKIYDVSGNMLTGTLPNFFGEMDQNKWSLGQVIISNNMLTGEIDIDHLPSVIFRFEFEGNNFEGFPDLSGFERLVTVKADLPADLDFAKLPPGLPTLDLSGLSGDFPDLSKFTKLTELVLYPNNPELKAVVRSEKLPLDGALTRLVIGHTLDVPGEDPNNPDRMCADITDEAFKTWVMRSDTTFVGAYCGQASGSSGGGGSVVRLARIEPSIGDVRVRAGDDVKLSLNIFGRQGAQDQSLADSATFMWSVGDDALAGTGSSISYTAPSSPGTYIVTASLPESQCHGLGDSAANCTATFEVQVLRSSPAPIPTAAPSDPPGVPEILADSDGNQYEVFTPASGGSFNDGMVTLTADAGAVPNGEVVGLRVDAAGDASNAGMTHQRYTLYGDAYTLSAVDISGASVSDYRLNSPAQLCVPLPDALRSNISDLAMLVSNPDGTLTVLSTTVHVSGNGVLGCGNISTVPATVALGTSGAPAAIPTATPEPTPIPPETGGYTPTTTATPWLLLLLLGTATTAAATTLVLRRRRASSEV